MRCLRRKPPKVRPRLFNDHTPGRVSVETPAAAIKRGQKAASTKVSEKACRDKPFLT